VELHVITSEGGAPLEGATMHFLPNRGGRLSHYYAFPWQVRSLLKRLDVDVVHAFGDDWALGRRGFAWVRTFHGSSLSEARSSRGLRKWNHYVLSALEHRVRRACDYAIAVGPESFEEFGCDRLMPPVSAPSTPVNREPSVEPQVLFVGTWKGRKRGDFAASICAEASVRLGRPVRLHVVGPAVDAANWPIDVSHHADPSDDEVQELLGRTWLLIAPSSYEGFGIPAFEALAAQVPSVSSPNPGSRYISGVVGDREAFDVADDARIVDSVVSRLQLGPLLRGESSLAAATAAASMLKSGSAAETVDIYRDVLFRRSTSPSR
jgi:glycosyltransferase involved in cell wall biosynthesis